MRATNSEKQKMQEYRKRRNDAVVEIAKENGTLDRMALILSAVHLLMTEASMLGDDMEELMKDAGIQKSSVLGASNRLIQAFDLYYASMKQFISAENVVKWAEDLQTFDGTFRAFTGLDVPFELKDIDLEAINKKYNVNFAYADASADGVKDGK